MKSIVSQFMHTGKNEKTRLFCFHYAGGSGFLYADWFKLLPDTTGVYPVELPGRGIRMQESFAASLEEAAQEFAAELSGFDDKPMVFTGHSMGGILAYLTAYYLEAQYSIHVKKLFLTSSAPDICASDKMKKIKAEDLTDDEFCEELISFGALDSRMMRLREFREIFLPIARADFGLVSGFVPDPRMKVSCDISVYGGLYDLIVQPDKYSTWAEYTAGNVTIELMKGDHFFIKAGKKTVCRDIAAYLQARYSENDSGLCG